MDNFKIEVATSSTGSDSSSSHKSLYKEPALMMRDVLSLTPTNKLDAVGVKINIEHNYVLQDGFSVSNGAELINSLKYTYSTVDKQGDIWLTGYIQSMPKIALMLNVAADLITEYQVSPDQYQKKTEEVCEYLLDQDPQFEVRLNHLINTELDSADNKKKIETSVNAEMELFAHKDQGEQETIKTNIERLERLKIGKKVTNQIVSRYVKEKLSESALVSLLPPKKNLHSIGNNHDVCALGAAGSGKSYILANEHPELDKKDMVILATDEYRGLYAPDIAKHESTNTKQGFTRTQDLAYLAKELVMERICAMQGNERPNIMFDGVTFERKISKLLDPSKDKLLTFVACLPEARLAPDRAFNRAENEKLSAADRGRHINTTALLEGHKKAGSEQLIDGLPDIDCKVTLYNTHTNTGDPPKVFGEVENRVNPDTNKVKALIKITDLKSASAYFAKQNINPEAQMKQEMYMLRELKKDGFKYSHYHKARSMLSLLSLPEGRIREKEMTLGNEHGREYLKISLQKDKTGNTCFVLDVTDPVFYNQQLKSDPLFKEMVSQANMYNTLASKKADFPAFKSEEGNEAVRTERFTLGKKVVEAVYLRPFSP